MLTIGIDTSNYTTSIACFDGVDGINNSKLLPVKEGELGLRQSDAVFSHIKSLPDLSGRLFSNSGFTADHIQAIGVSTRPRAVEGSYMPCFLVGLSHASILADLLKVPLIQVSHQQGHIAAVLWNAGRLDILDQPFLAWHLSGGTTELLLAEPDNKNIKCTKIGGTSDISAGQLIDRTGQLLKVGFPSGKQLDEMSQYSIEHCSYRVKCTNSIFSLSGVQNKVSQYFSSTNDIPGTAYYALRSVAQAVKTATEQACKEYPGLPVVFSGGVASNTLLRTVMKPFDAIFAEPRYSTDNALGTAVLAYRLCGE